MRLLTWLREHPMFWIVPILFWGTALFLLAWKISQTPANPHVYEL